MSKLEIPRTSDWREVQAWMRKVSADIGSILTETDLTLIMNLLNQLRIDVDWVTNNCCNEDTYTDVDFFEYGAKTDYFYHEDEEMGTVGDGDENVGFGDAALAALTTGKYNTAVGYHALTADTTGGYNTAVGDEALVSNTIGRYNTIIGMGCAYYNDEGDANTVVGNFSLYSLSGDYGYNVAIGSDTMSDAYRAEENVAIGENALGYGGYDPGEDIVNNIAIGTIALGSLTEGSARNIAIGDYSLWEYHYDGYDDNVAVGYQAMTSGGYSSENTVVGNDACYDMEWGTGNVALGKSALSDASDPIDTIAIGRDAGGNERSGVGNIYVGEGTTLRDFGDPTISLSLSAAAPGVDAGYQYYGVTFVFSDGRESSLMFEDTPVDVTAGNHQVNLSSIPTYTTSMGPFTCVSRNIYRTKLYALGGYPLGHKPLLYLVGSIADNTTTTFTDTTPEASLGAEYAGPSNAVAIGSDTIIDFSNSMALGRGIADFFFGDDVFDASPTDVILHASGGFGEDVDGADISIAGGKGTGSGAGGSVKFMVAPPGATGSVENALADALTIDDAKVVREYNDTTGENTPTLGSNCPGSGDPYVWWKVKTSDGTVGYIPIWVEGA